MHMWFVDVECVAWPGPLKVVHDNLKKSFSAMLSKPLNILKTSIKSPRNLLVSRVDKPNFRNLSMYGGSFKSYFSQLNVLRCGGPTVILVYLRVNMYNLLCFIVLAAMPKT